MNLEERIKCALEDGPVLIYGAHLIAIETYRYICQIKKNPLFAGFVVTSAENNPAEIMGEEVVELADCRAARNTTVMIAMPEKYHNEAQAYAESLGFYSFIRVGLENLSAVKGGRLLHRQRQESDLHFRLYEYAYVARWLDVTEDLEDHGSAPIVERRHYKFPTLFHLDEETVFQLAKGFHFDLEYERLFGAYRSVHALPARRCSDDEELPLRVYMVFSRWDNTELSKQALPPWICPIQAGSILTEYKAGAYLDESGENISGKNGVLAEMTAAYWIWKNAKPTKYKGLCHYRRHFLLDETDIMALESCGVDVVLPVPHYAPGGVRQMFLAETAMKDPVYQMLLRALSEIHPEDAARVEAAMEACFYSPNNMVIARSEIYDAYCAWIFPVLFRMMELDEEVHYGHERDRHIAYAAELLTSCYFVLHKDRFHIRVTDYRFIT